MIMRCLPSGTQTLPCFLVYFPILTSIYIFVWLPKVSQKWPQFLCQYQKTFRSWLQPAQLATPTSHSPKWMGWFIPFTSNNRGQNPIIIIISGGCEILSTWVKQCHKPPIWEWFIPPISGDLGDCLLLFYPHQTPHGCGLGRLPSNAREGTRLSHSKNDNHAAKRIENDDAFISQIKTYL